MWLGRIDQALRMVGLLDKQFGEGHFDLALPGSELAEDDAQVEDPGLSSFVGHCLPSLSTRYAARAGCSATRRRKISAYPWSRSTRCCERRSKPLPSRCGYWLPTIAWGDLAGCCRRK